MLVFGIAPDTRCSWCSARPRSGCGTWALSRRCSAFFGAGV